MEILSTSENENTSDNPQEGYNFLSGSNKTETELKMLNPEKNVPDMDEEAAPDVISFEKSMDKETAYFTFNNKEYFDLDMRG